MAIPGGVSPPTALGEVQLTVGRLRLRPWTPASCAVARRCAYGLEGVLRDAGLYRDGRHDEHLHARLRTDVEPG